MILINYYKLNNLLKSFINLFAYNLHLSPMIYLLALLAILNVIDKLNIKFTLKDCILESNGLGKTRVYSWLLRF